MLVSYNLGACLDSGIPRIPVYNFIIFSAQAVRLCYIMLVGRRDGNRVYQSTASIHLNGAFHSKLPSVALLRLVHLRTPCPVSYTHLVTKDGKIVARQIEEIHDTGAYGGFGPYAVDKSVFTITGPYDVPNVNINGYCVFNNKPVATSMRGFGIKIGQVAMEAHMDKIAETLNMSPWELRFKNAWKEGTLSSTQQEMHAVGLIETLQATAKLAGEKLSPELLAMSSK